MGKAVVEGRRPGGQVQAGHTGHRLGGEGQVEDQAGIVNLEVLQQEPSQEGLPCYLILEQVPAGTEHR